MTVFCQDVALCDPPESTRLDVRMEMPQDSVWNVKQRELAEQMEHEYAEREEQEAADQAGDSGEYNKAALGDVWSGNLCMY